MHPLNKNEVFVINSQVNFKTGRALIFCALAVSTLVSCATRGTDVDVPSSLPRQLPSVPESTQGSGQGAAVGTVTAAPPGGSISGGAVSGGALTRGAINDPSHPLARRIIFFGYNSAEIGSESIDLLEQHAEYLSQFRDVRVRLEGHTDERGSREYNIALGDNRSRGVARILQLQGVDAGQFSTLSYGEEVPLDEGSGESAWRRNRRVELVYEGLN